MKEDKSSLIQGLKEYFDSTPKEQLEQELEPHNEYRTTIMEALTPHPTIGIAECAPQYAKYNSFDGWEMKRTNVQEHYYVYKDGRCLSDYDTFTEASEHSKRIDGDVFTDHTEPICWDDMSGESQADFFIALPHPKK